MPGGVEDDIWMTSMGRLYIYLHENHTNSTIYVGKYIPVPWMVLVVYHAMIAGIVINLEICV